MRTAATAFLLCLSFAAHAQEDIRAHFISVGQGDATLFEFPGCGVMMIDAGATLNQPATPLTNYLTAFFASRPAFNNTIDLIINTHQHDDHLRSLDEVFTNHTVLRYVDNGEPLAPNSKAIRTHATVSGPVQALAVADEDVVSAPSVGLTNETIDPFDCPGMDPVIAILSGRIQDRPDGWTTKDFQNPNNHSLVIRVDYGQASFLFTGDMEDVALEYMVGYYEGTGALDVDVYHVGHHGSANGTTTSLIAEMTPLISVVSMGQWDIGRNTNMIGTAWRHGHPRKDIVRALGAATERRRATPVDVMVATGSKVFETMRVTKAVYGTGWTDRTVVITATSSGTYTVNVNQN